MKPHVQIVRKSSPPSPPPAKPAPPPAPPAAAAAVKAAPPKNPPGTVKRNKEKAFVSDVFQDKLLCVTLINGTVVYGRIIFWDRYTFGLTPDGDGMPMLVHKQHFHPACSQRTSC